MCIKVDDVGQQAAQLAEDVVVSVGRLVTQEVVEMAPSARTAPVGRAVVLTTGRLRPDGRPQEVRLSTADGLGVAGLARRGRAHGRVRHRRVVQLGFVVQLGRVSTAWIEQTVSSSPR